MKIKKVQKNLLSNSKNKMIDQRFERKYIFGKTNIDKIILAIYRSNFNFISSFPDRIVNSIYFDDNDLSSIADNLDGVTEKKKIRLRWYGSTKLINNSKLELKQKSEFLVHKKEYNLQIPKNFEFQNKKNIKFIKNLINNDKNLRKQITKKTLEPILSTHYCRSYFLSSDKLVRLTMDKNIEYIHLANNKDINIKKKTNNIIIEIKYRKEIDNLVRKKIDNISVRFSKNSKYIHGAQLLEII